jgi:hypothetical protein
MPSLTRSSILTVCYPACSVSLSFWLVVMPGKLPLVDYVLKIYRVAPSPTTMVDDLELPTTRY